jgi:hypothetical protein
MRLASRGLRWEVQRKWKTSGEVFYNDIAYLVWVCKTIKDMMWCCGVVVLWMNLGGSGLMEDREGFRKRKKEGKGYYIDLEAALALPRQRGGMTHSLDSLANLWSEYAG